MITYQEDIHWPGVVSGFPMPGDRFYRNYRIVASVWGNDDPDDGVVFATVIALAEQSPFYRVGQVEVNERGEWQPVGDWRYHYNIVFAVEDYEDSGGDV